MIERVEERSLAAMSEDDIFFSVDCETSGPFPGRHALLSVGVVLVRRAKDHQWTLADSLYREWAPPPNAEEDPAATRVHGLDLDSLRAHAIGAKEGAAELALWVASHSARRRIFVGYNAAFDWAFVLYALGFARVESPFHHAPLDLKSAIWGVHGGTWRSNSNIEALERTVGRRFAPTSRERAHNALDDARLQARVLVGLLDHLRAADPKAAPT